MVTIKNTDASANIKVTEIIHRETILAPSQQLDTDPDTVEVNVEVST